MLMPWDPYRNFFLEIAPGHLTSKFYTVPRTTPVKIPTGTGDQLSATRMDSGTSGHTAVEYGERRTVDFLAILGQIAVLI